ncbi:RNAligase [Wolffia australiana]
METTSRPNRRASRRPSLPAGYDELQPRISSPVPRREERQGETRGLGDKVPSRSGRTNHLPPSRPVQYRPDNFVPFRLYHPVPFNTVLTTSFRSVSPVPFRSVLSIVPSRAVPSLCGGQMKRRLSGTSGRHSHPPKGLSCRPELGEGGGPRSASLAVCMTSLQPRFLCRLLSSPLPRRPVLLRLFGSAASPRFSRAFSAMPSGRRKKSGASKGGIRQAEAHDEQLAAAEAVTSQLHQLVLPATSGRGPSPTRPSSSSRSGSSPLLSGPVENRGLKKVWASKSYGTSSGTAALAVEKESGVAVSPGKCSSAEVSGTSKEESRLSKLFKGPLGENFSVDTHTFARARIRATFYPKFENEKSDQEVRSRMIELVSHGLATLEVSLKHSGSLFMYAGHRGGAYAKNSYGNIYSAVGVFVLGRMFMEAWGGQARKKQAEFNEFLEKKHMCISMELVTAVLGDHGQRPLDDYVVVTAVTELGSGKPTFYSTPDVLAFCRKWRLPTNHIWLFSTRKSVTSFFAAYDALCEEGTATPVCQALDEVAEISVPGSKDHVKVQGEILEGLVARIVSPDSAKHMNEVLKEFPTVPYEQAGDNFGPTLREVCAANRSDEKDQIRSLLQNLGSDMCPDHVDWFGFGDMASHSRNADRSVLTKFLQARPADFSTTKLQEMISLMRQRHFQVAFKCYYNFHKIDSLSADNLDFKMVIHVHSDSVFRRYQQEMRRNPGLWPLYRGFFVDVNIFKGKESTSELDSNDGSSPDKTCSGSVMSESLADEDTNLMIKLKFLTYKIRTFLIRNGLSILFKDGPAAYKTYYLRQMKNWGTSTQKQKDLSRMLDEWAVYIRRKCGHKQLPSSTYLSEAEPFLEQYAKRSKQNQALIGSAGNLVRTEDFLAVLDADRDEEGDLVRGDDSTPPPTTVLDKVPQKEGLIVFFPGIPGCAKSALCREILNSPGLLGDERPVHSLMGDMIKGRYWQKVADERKKRPFTVTLADKNAPNEEVWKQIEDMCIYTKASAVPVIPDSEGTDTNPFSLDALAVFMLRVLQRVNHPGNLDKASPNAGYVLLMFYKLYEGKSRREFESELIERFGSLVRMPLLKPERDPLPDAVKSIIEEGLALYRLHTNKHGRLEPSKGAYAKEWSQWEKRLREIMLQNADHLNTIQVPFEYAVEQVAEQLKAAARGEFRPPPGGVEKRKFGSIVYVAVALPPADVTAALSKVAEADEQARRWLAATDLSALSRAHLTLAHKRSHGVAAVAGYGVFAGRQVPVELTALLLSDNLAALEAAAGAAGAAADDEGGAGEKVASMNEWPHVTVWIGPGASAKNANSLPLLVSQGKAQRVDIRPPLTLLGTVQFY